ncbi:MAG: glycosyltransferase [Muribaculaceae bacterium]
MILVSIIIVNYRVKYFLEQTIRSAQEALAGIDDSGEIIIVDNASGDDSMDFIKSRFGDSVTYIENTENVGFARANNQAIAIAKGEFTLILNPDTIICRDTLRKAIEWFKSHADCGAIGVRMLDGNGIFLPESKRAFTTPWVSFCKIFGLSALFPQSKIFARYHLRYLDEHKAHKVDILAGAFILARTEILRGIEGFDERFFMYGEDIDLSYRIVKEGFSNYYLPIPIIHYKGESTKKDSMRYVRVFYEAMLIFFKKHYPHYSKFFAFFIRFAIYARALMAVLRRIFIRKSNLSLKKSTHRWQIISNDCVRIKNVIGSEAIFTESSPTDIVFDDSALTYSEIIDAIDSRSNGKLHFHIYSSRNGIIISPKMSIQ